MNKNVCLLMIYYSCGLQKSTFVGGSYLREFNFILYKYFWVGLSIIYIWIEKKSTKKYIFTFPPYVVWQVLSCKIYRTKIVVIIK